MSHEALRAKMSAETIRSKTKGLFHFFHLVEFLPRKKLYSDFLRSSSAWVAKRLVTTSHGRPICPYAAVSV